MKSKENPSHYSGLPKNITNVRRVLDESNVFRGKLSITTRAKGSAGRTYILDSSHFILNKLDELAKLCICNDWLEAPETKQIKRLAQILVAAAREKPPIRMLAGDGFHQIVDGKKTFACHVLRDRAHWVDGDEPETEHAVYGSATSLAEASGTLASWNANIGCHLAGNQVVLVAVCAGLAAPLVPQLNLSTASLMLCGPSSLGKSTVQHVVQSLTDSPPEQSGSTTAFSMRQTLLKARHRTAIVHDMQLMGEMQPYAALLYDLGNGASRGSGVTGLTAPLQCTFIGSSEHSFLGLLQAGRGNIANTGLAARVFEVHVRAPNGVFHTLPKNTDARTFSKQLNEAAKQHHGALWDAWIAMVAKDGSRIRSYHQKKFGKICRALQQEVATKDPVTLRLIENVAGWAFAGCVAACLKLLPITTTEVMNVFKKIMRAQATLPNGFGKTGAAVISHVRGFFDQKAAFFPELQKDLDVADQSTEFGFSHKFKGQRVYLVLVSAFKKHIGDKFGDQMAIDALIAGEFLIKDAEGNQKKFRVGSGFKRFYVIRAVIHYDAE